MTAKKHDRSSIPSGVPGRVAAPTVLDARRSRIGQRCGQATLACTLLSVICRDAVFRGAEDVVSLLRLAPLDLPILEQGRRGLGEVGDQQCILEGVATTMPTRPARVYCFPRWCEQLVSWQRAMAFNRAGWPAKLAPLLVSGRTRKNRANGRWEVGDVLMIENMEAEEVE